MIMINLFVQLTGTTFTKWRRKYDKAPRWIKCRVVKDILTILTLIFSEANLYLTSGNIPEARRVLQLAIDRDPENANLYYAFAVNYDQMSRDTLLRKMTGNLRLKKPYQIL
jgi:predicted Zn-dependent protease